MKEPSYRTEHLILRHLESDDSTVDLTEPSVVFHLGGPAAVIVWPQKELQISPTVLGVGPAGGELRNCSAELLVCGVRESAWLSCEKEYQIRGVAAAFQEPKCHAVQFWFSEIINRIFFEVFRCQRFNSLATRFCALEILKEIFYQQDINLKPDSDVTFAKGWAAAKLRIESRFSEKLTLEDLSIVARMSISTLTRKFKAELGVTPMVYLRQVRMTRAKALLNGNLYNVSEVASLVGYEELSAFSSSFRETFQISPSKIKNKKL